MNSALDRFAIVGEVFGAEGVLEWDSGFGGGIRD